MFNLFAERLGRLIKKRKLENQIKGIRIGQEIEIIHLQFVDATGIWDEATIREATSGQLLNEAKSKVVFFNVTS